MRLMHVQTVLTEDEVRQLLKKTGERSRMGALRKAVEHYLSCPHAGRD